MFLFQGRLDSSETLPSGLLFWWGDLVSLVDKTVLGAQHSIIEGPGGASAPQGPASKAHVGVKG